MRNENSAPVLTEDGKPAVIPALICAGICAALMRVGFFSFFFLVPLGFCAVCYNQATAWLCFTAAVIANGLLSAVLTVVYQTGLAGIGLDMLFFAVLAMGFTWIMAGNPARWPAVFRRTLFRFMAVSAAAAVMLLWISFAAEGSSGFWALPRSQIEAIASAYIESAGGDAAQRAFLERLLTPERIIETLSVVILRGGALMSAFFLFFVSRQAAFVLAGLLKRRRPASGLAFFHVPRGAIWVLSLCLPVILAGRVISAGVEAAKIAEIAAWNVLIACAVMFLAQGCGIVLFTLARRAMPPLMRFFTSVLFVLLLFSPGINALVVVVLILLGIAENWLPLRVIKQRPPTGAA